MNIVVAGATGYIGTSLLPRLVEKFPEAHITALSRRGKSSEFPQIAFVQCDLFSLKSLEKALPSQVDLAIYLVHSMGPTAQLDQGSFADYDLILADNFSRAMRKTGVKQVVYLGGLIPEGKALSLHLQSRLEVEETFRQYGLPTTVFRAGIILGEAGSSTQILLKLVRRLPVMVCPAWTTTLTSPVDLESVLQAILASALNRDTFNQVYDLASCRPLTYLEMMRQTGRRLGKRRWFFNVPFFSPTLSRLWVSLVTNSPRELVYPLIQSLAHPMVARPDRAFPGIQTERTYFELLQSVNMVTRHQGSFFHFKPPGKTVRSVQRLPLPAGRDAIWASTVYMQWLVNFLRPLIRVKIENTTATLSLLFFRSPLLVLHLSQDRSTPDRQLLYIREGVLFRGGERARLEFRVVLGGRFILAAIHDYRPSLPWLVYKFTQARVHLFLMRAFGRYLGGCAR